MISIAPTRSGKGVSLIIPNLLTYRGSVLVVDPKGENAWITAAYRRRRARPENGHPRSLGRGQSPLWIDGGSLRKRSRGSIRCRSSIPSPTSMSMTSPIWRTRSSSARAAETRIGTTPPASWWPVSSRSWSRVRRTGLRLRLALVRGLLTLPDAELRIAIKDAMTLEPGSIARAKLARFDASTDEINSIMSYGAHADGLSR